MKINFKRMNNAQLVLNIKNAARDENLLLSDCLAYLCEIRRRRLYSSQGYSSLYDFCVDNLPLSDGAIYRRIQVSEHVQRVPLLLEMIALGKISLTVASKIVPFFNSEDPNELIKQFLGLTTREADHLLGAKFDRGESRDQIRRTADKVSELRQNNLLDAIKGKGSSRVDEGGEIGAATNHDSSEDQKANYDTTTNPTTYPMTNPSTNPTTNSPKEIVREKRFTIKFTASEEVKNKIQRAKELLSHKCPKGKLEDIFENILDEYLSKNAPENQQSRKPSKPHNPDSDYIPKNIKREVFKRANYCCQATSSSGKRCGTRFQLEIDHIFSRAHGGKTELTNLQVLCKSHNFHKAKSQMGESFVNRKIEERKNIKLARNELIKASELRPGAKHHTGENELKYPIVASQRSLF
jgi:5-methylcytosine-specific restriction endonuclease McrA